MNAVGFNYVLTLMESVIIKTGTMYGMYVDRQVDQDLQSPRTVEHFELGEKGENIAI